MAKVYIFTDEKEAVEFSGEIFDEVITNMFGEDIFFLLSEDSKDLFLTEDGTSIFIQEQ